MSAAPCHTPVLAVDIGNTSVTVAFMRNRTIVCQGRRLTRLSDPAGIRRFLRKMLSRDEKTGVVVASVVPSATPLWAQAARLVCRTVPLRVTSKLHLGFRFDYPEPHRLGADRLANACGAVATYGAGVAVADFGTALTFDIVSREGAYIGGIIAPGPQGMLDYLADRTALLPRLKLGGCRKAIGKNTSEAMMAGVRIGYTGLVRALQAAVEREIGYKLRWCATGGYAAWGAAGLDMRVDPDLTLRGLAEIYRLNRRSKQTEMRHAGG